jgi:hypothetical protein
VFRIDVASPIAGQPSPEGPERDEVSKRIGHDWRDATRTQLCTATVRERRSEAWVLTGSTSVDGLIALALGRVGMAGAAVVCPLADADGTDDGSGRAGAECVSRRRVWLGPRSCVRSLTRAVQMMRAVQMARRVCEA